MKKNKFHSRVSLDLNRPPNFGKKVFQLADNPEPWDGRRPSRGVGTRGRRAGRWLPLVPCFLSIPKMIHVDRGTFRKQRNFHHSSFCCSEGDNHACERLSCLSLSDSSRHRRWKTTPSRAWPAPRCTDSGRLTPPLSPLLRLRAHSCTHNTHTHTMHARAHVHLR